MPHSVRHGLHVDHGADLSCSYRVCSPALFTSDPRSDRGCRVLIPVAGVFQIFDGAQAVGAGVLRGLGDTRAPLIGMIAGYWLIGSAGESAAWLSHAAACRGACGGALSHRSASLRSFSRCGFGCSSGGRSGESRSSDLVESSGIFGSFPAGPRETGIAKGTQGEWMTRMNRIPPRRAWRSLLNPNPSPIHRTCCSVACQSLFSRSSIAARADRIVRRRHRRSTRRGRRSARRLRERVLASRFACDPDRAVGRASREVDVEEEIQVGAARARGIGDPDGTLAVVVRAVDGRAEQVGVLEQQPCVGLGGAGTVLVLERRSGRERLERDRRRRARPASDRRIRERTPVPTRRRSAPRVGGTSVVLPVDSEPIRTTRFTRADGSSDGAARGSCATRSEGRSRRARGRSRRAPP